jgi:hypothetical protein
MPPPRHALAALLLDQGHCEEAEQGYRDDLGLSGTVQRSAQHLNNVWALHGLVECLSCAARSKNAGAAGKSCPWRWPRRTYRSLRRACAERACTSATAAVYQPHLRRPRDSGEQMLDVILDKSGRPRFGLDAPIGALAVTICGST